MRRATPGKYVEVVTAGERVRAFVPAPLPPDPPVVWSPALRRRFDDALVALGLCASKGEARRLIKGGGARVNAEKITDELHVIPKSADAI